MVEVTEETYIEFIKGRGNQVMRPGKSGPVWGDVTPPTHDQVLADVERQRTALLLYADTVTADWRTELALGDISDDDRIKLSAWMAYKRAVKAVIAEDAIRDGFQWPAIPA
ncbi:TPA: tail fiber assembly protein [Citrobacter freundii]|nr:tail fiber assembly protein [Citrobacter freundii]HBB4765809.1 tail fiber assembly protein [Citrobacter freundii]